MKFTSKWAKQFEGSLAVLDEEQQRRRGFTKTGKIPQWLYRRDILPGFCVQIVATSGPYHTLCRAPATFGQTCFEHSRIGEIHDFLEGLCAFIIWVKGATP